MRFTKVDQDHQPGSGFQLVCLWARDSSESHNHSVDEGPAGLRLGCLSRVPLSREAGARLAPTPAKCRLFFFCRAPCSAPTWLRTPRRPLPPLQPRCLSLESRSSRGPRAPLPPLLVQKSPWRELTQKSLTRTWPPLPSSACDRPPAPGTGASRWCVTHILCGAWVYLDSVRGPAGPSGREPCGLD